MSESPIYAAVEILFAARHRLPGDVIRSLDSILFCASAALYGGPEGYVPDPQEWAEHTVAGCEAEDATDDLDRERSFGWKFDAEASRAGLPPIAAEDTDDDLDPWSAEAER